MVEYLLATDEQKKLAEGARKILEKELAPRIEELEKADGGLGEYPLDVHNTLVQAGYYGMNIPEEWGGLGIDIVSQAIINEEMSKVDAGFTFNFYHGGAFFPLILQTKMSTEEKQKWADSILAGKSIGCFALTEAEAGSDAAAMRTTAVKEGNEWVINGTKTFITNGPTADHFLIAAWTDKSKKVSQGVTFFFVEKERGVTAGKKENKMGLKLSETSEVVLDNVRVPEDHVIGEVGRGFVTSLEVISSEGRVLGSAVNLGLAQASLDHAVKYAKERRTFGKRIIDHQGLGFMIANMHARTAASRALLYQTLTYIHQGIKIGSLGSVVKMYVSDSTMQTTSDAVQILGGYGYMKEYPVEKLMRDAKIFQIFSGTNQVQLWNIAKALAGKDN